MKLRPSPALVVAVLALVAALAGTSYAAATIGSAQIKNNSVKSKDVKDGNLTGKDLKDGSLTGADVSDGSLSAADVVLPAPGCAATALRVGEGCLVKATRGPSTLNAAILDCHGLGGRLPTFEEVKVLAQINALGSGVTWAEGNPAQYQFTGTFGTDGGTTKDLLADYNGNPLFHGGENRNHHCVVPLS